jgi:protein SCO1/2
MISRRTLLGGLSIPFASAVAGAARPIRVAAASVAATSANGHVIPPSTNRRNFPNVELITHDNRPVRFYDDLVKGKIVLFNFFYTRCDGICLPNTANLVKVQRLLGDRVGNDIFMYSISLKPREDSPNDLRAYRDMYNVGPGWTFLTGKPANCDLIRRRLGFADVDPVRDADVTQHSGLVIFGNEPLDSWTGCPAAVTASEIVKAVSWVDWR